MACPFCGCFNGYSGSPGYEPGDDDFARSKRAVELLALAAAGDATDDDRAEMRGIVNDAYRSL